MGTNEETRVLVTGTTQFVAVNSRKSQGLFCFFTKLLNLHSTLVFTATTMIVVPTLHLEDGKAKASIEHSFVIP